VGRWVPGCDEPRIIGHKRTGAQGANFACSATASFGAADDTTRRQSWLAALGIGTRAGASDHKKGRSGRSRRSRELPIDKKTARCSRGTIGPCSFGRAAERPGSRLMIERPGGALELHSGAGSTPAPVLSSSFSSGSWLARNFLLRPVWPDPEGGQGTFIRLLSAGILPVVSRFVPR